MKLVKIVSFTGKITLRTGMHIGGVNNHIKIGGVDSEVIKHPVTQEPYIPGSSLKGKMRSQLEKVLGKVDVRGGPCMCGQRNCIVCKLFGAHKNTKSDAAPTRLIVRDSYFTEETREKYEKLLMEKGLSYIEQKAENTINRNKGTADSPRFIERVPEGTEFELNINLQIFDNDDVNELKKAVVRTLKLVEDSYIGGSGSRGYGQVKFDYSIDEKII